MKEIFVPLLVIRGLPYHGFNKRENDDQLFVFPTSENMPELPRSRDLGKFVADREEIQVFLSILDSDNFENIEFVPEFAFNGNQVNESETLAALTLYGFKRSQFANLFSPLAQ